MKPLAPAPRVVGSSKLPGPILEDTLLAHFAFASHMPKSLAHVVSVFCDSRPWKLIHGKDAAGEKGTAPWQIYKRKKGGKRGAGRKAPKAVAVEVPTTPVPAEEVEVSPDAVKNLLDYNAKDAKLTILAWKRMKNDLASETEVYKRDKVVAGMCRRMTEVGIGFDVKERQQLSQHLRARKRGLLAAMRAHVKSDRFHPAKLDHLRRVLFEDLKAPLLRPTPTGLAATDSETLEWLATMDTAAGKLARMTLQWRAAGKTLGSYVDNVDFVEHTPEYGRVHPPWKLGPVTGRLSCWLMTLPRYGDDWNTHVRKLYIPNPKSTKARLVAQIHDAAIFEVEGRFVYFDLSQAEARLAAYFSGDPELIKACEGDIHLANAMVVFADIPEVMARLARGNELSPFLDKKGKPLKWKAVESKKDGCKDERDIAKNCGFCVWYEGTAERALATLHGAGKTKATLKSCQELVRRFHGRYKRYYRYIDENEAYVRQEGHLRTVLLKRIRWVGYYAKRTEISNFPIQSGIADLQNERLPRIEEAVKDLDKVDDVKRIIKEVWQEPIKIPHNGLEFVIPIDLKDGERWSDFG